MKDLKKSFKSRKFKMGAYQTLIMVIVIVLVIILNLVVNKMNITVDLSSDKIYTLTDDTKKLVSGIKDDIKMYYMCQEGNQTTQIEKVLEQYNGLGNIEVVDKDPVVYPNFSKQFTEDEIKDNDVIVVDETSGKNKVVASADMLVQDMDYQTYQQTYTLDAEGQLTAALQNVTSKESKKLYYTSGHNETAIDSGLKDILNKSSITMAELATASEKSVPDDCNILLINGPQYDFTADEYNLISDYLKNGGKAMFFLNAATTEKMTNYYKLLSDYGVNAVDGYVIDSQGAMNADYPTMLVPKAQEHDITADIGEKMTVLPVCKGLTKQSDVRSTLTVDSLLTTTDSAFSKVDMKSQTTDKEDKDIAGPFDVAVAVKDAYTENTQGEGKAAEIIVFGSVNFEAADFTSNDQYGNRSMLLKSVSYLCGSNTSTLAIPTRSLDEQSVTIKDADRIFFTALCVVVIPLILLGVGFGIWFKRRKN